MEILLFILAACVAAIAVVVTTLFLAAVYLFLKLVIEAEANQEES